MQIFNRGCNPCRRGFFPRFAGRDEIRESPAKLHVKRIIKTFIELEPAGRKYPAPRAGRNDNPMLRCCANDDAEQSRYEIRRKVMLVIPWRTCGSSAALRSSRTS